MKHDEEDGNIEEIHDLSETVTEALVIKQGNRTWLDIRPVRRLGLPPTPPRTELMISVYDENGSKQVELFGSTLARIVRAMNLIEHNFDQINSGTLAAKTRVVPQKGFQQFNQDGVRIHDDNSPGYLALANGGNESSISSTDGRGGRGLVTVRNLRQSTDDEGALNPDDA